MESLLVKYKFDLEGIQSLSKYSFSLKVRKAVSEVAFNQLQEECGSKKKTAHLKYSSLTLQPYFEVLYPSQSRIVFKCRSQSLDIKTHLTYKYGSDTVCRGCGCEEETYSHIVNCSSEPIDVVDMSKIDDIDNMTKVMVQKCVVRIRDFMNLQSS